MKNRETLNFYRSFYEAGKQLQNEERLQFYDAILEKSFEKNVKKKKLNGIADILFTAILPTITSQNRNYLNGIKGVKAKKTNPPKNNKTTTLDNSLTTYKEKEKEKEKEKDKEKDNNIKESVIKSFESWWELYEKKGNRKKSLEKWLKLNQEQRDKCFHVVHDYVKATPDKQYRKNGETYLNQESWNDEIIQQSKGNKKTNEDFNKELDYGI